MEVTPDDVCLGATPESCHGGGSFMYVCPHVSGARFKFKFGRNQGRLGDPNSPNPTGLNLGCRPFVQVVNFDHNNFDYPRLRRMYTAGS